MKDAVTAANEQVRTVRKKRGKDDEMGTTLVAAWIGPEGLRWVSVGDSLLLLIREEKMFLLNDLHQYSAELERMADEGSISREEALSHPSRHSPDLRPDGEGSAFGGSAGRVLPSGSRGPPSGRQRRSGALSGLPGPGGDAVLVHAVRGGIGAVRAGRHQP